MGNAEEGTARLKLHPRIKTALQAMEFVPRYEALSKRFDAERTPLQERLRYLDGEIVLETLAKLGCAADFDAREKFFRLRERRVEELTFGANLILTGGMVDFVWVVREGGRLLLGLPLGEYARLLIRPEYRIKKPIFGTYEDLEEILRDGLRLFEDFQRALLETSAPPETEK